ncbi:MAG TPA: preprotein translocase subunit SecD, partial [Methanothrix soehngenii]|nr:preprotein translocase subunit SecD [Methanothrix soehngenii]
MSLIEDLSRDKRVLLFALFLAAALICLGAFGLKYGLDLQGGSYLQLKLQGAMVQVDADPESILEYQFANGSVERRGDSYIVTVPGRIDPTLPDNLGYMGAETAALANATKITIPAAPETIIINYLQKNLDADVKIVQFAPV